jgi:hypothetical protein
MAILWWFYGDSWEDHGGFMVIYGDSWGDHGDFMDMFMGNVGWTMGKWWFMIAFLWEHAELMEI